MRFIKFTPHATTVASKR